MIFNWENCSSSINFMKSKGYVVVGLVSCMRELDVVVCVDLGLLFYCVLEEGG